MSDLDRSRVNAMAQLIGVKNLSGTCWVTAYLQYVRHFTFPATKTKTALSYDDFSDFCNRINRMNQSQIADESIINASVEHAKIAFVFLSEHVALDQPETLACTNGKTKLTEFIVLMKSVAFLVQFNQITTGSGALTLEQYKRPGQYEDPFVFMEIYRMGLDLIAIRDLGTIIEDPVAQLPRHRLLMEKRALFSTLTRRFFSPTHRSVRSETISNIDNIAKFFESLSRKVDEPNHLNIGDADSDDWLVKLPQQEFSFYLKLGGDGKGSITGCTTTISFADTKRVFEYQDLDIQKIQCKPGGAGDAVEPVLVANTQVEIYEISFQGAFCWPGKKHYTSIVSTDEGIYEINDETVNPLTKDDNPVTIQNVIGVFVSFRRLTKEKVKQVKDFVTLYQKNFPKKNEFENIKHEFDNDVNKEFNRKKLQAMLLAHPDHEFSKKILEKYGDLNAESATAENRASSTIISIPSSPEAGSEGPATSSNPLPVANRTSSTSPATSDVDENPASTPPQAAFAQEKPGAKDKDPAKKDLVGLDDEMKKKGAIADQAPAKSTPVIPPADSRPSKRKEREDPASPPKSAAALEFERLSARAVPLESNTDSNWDDFFENL